MTIPDTMKQRSDTIISHARQICQREKPKRISVAVAENREVIEAVEHGRQEGICTGIFVGNKEKILALYEEIGIDPGMHEIVDMKDETAATYRAVELGSHKEADIIMKGIINTSDFLKTVLMKEFNLRCASLLSHVAVLDIPMYHKLLAITDGAMVVNSNIQQRIQIVKNAVTVMHSLGIQCPKVALLAAIDQVNFGMPVTTESAIIAKMSDRSQIDYAVVDGPLTFDIAVSAIPTDYLNIKSPVAGDADVVVVPNLETGNMLIKSLDLFAEARFGGIIVGSKIPLCVVSRSDSAYNRLFSLALSVVYSNYLKVVKKDEC